MDVVALIQQAMEAARKVRELAKTIENADFKIALAELTDALAEAKLESVDLKIALADARQKTADLEAKLQQKLEGEPQVVDGLYVFPSKDGMFCTRCWDVEQRQVRIAANPIQSSLLPKWKCPECQAKFP